MATSSPTRPNAGFNTRSSRSSFGNCDGQEDFGSNLRHVAKFVFSSSQIRGKRFDWTTIADPGLLSGVRLLPNHGSQLSLSPILGNHSAGESRMTTAGSPETNAVARHCVLAVPFQILGADKACLPSAKFQFLAQMHHHLAVFAVNGCVRKRDETSGR